MTESSDLDYSTHNDKLKHCRMRIGRLSQYLRVVSISMLVWSVIFLLLKLDDFSDLATRLQKFETKTLYHDSQDPSKHKKYVSLYYEVNCLSLAGAVFSVVTSAYINLRLRENKIFAPALYKKFITACMIVVCLFLIAFAHLTITHLRMAKLDIGKHIFGFRALA